MFVVERGTDIGDDASSGDLYVYRTSDMTQELLVQRVGGRPVTAPSFSPGESPFIAYADWGDFYIYDLHTPTIAGEPVFVRGGGYAHVSECAYRGISDIHWAEDGKSLVFKYFPSVFEAEYELYEVLLTWGKTIP
jgi:hypothetical protein